MLAVFALTGIALVLVFTYGTLTADVVRYLVFFTGFSAIFSMLQGYRTGRFQGQASAGKTAVLLLVCILCYASADTVRSNIAATVEEAARQEWRFHNIWDVFNYFHKERTLVIISQAIALVFTLAVSVLSVLAQVSMRMEAYAVQHADKQNWRTRLFSVLSKQSSWVTLMFMLVVSTLSLAYAAGWITNLFT